MWGPKEWAQSPFLFVILNPHLMLKRFGIYNEYNFSRYINSTIISKYIKMATNGPLSIYLASIWQQFPRKFYINSDMNMLHWFSMVHLILKIKISLGPFYAVPQCYQSSSWHGSTSLTVSVSLHMNECFHVNMFLIARFTQILRSMLYLEALYVTNSFPYPT